jgi:hypothetical protein
MDYVEEVYPDKSTGRSYKFNLIEEEEYQKESEKLDMCILIKHENSKNNLGLQVVDLISGAIFQEIEKGNKVYTDLIKKHTEIKGGIIKPIWQN